MSEIILNSIEELFTYTNIQKLVVFRFLSVNGNTAFGNYDASSQLSNSDVEVFQMDVKSVNTITSTDETTANSFVMNDLNSNCMYSICFFQIPVVYQLVIKDNNTLVMYQQYELP
jgi:BRCT domain type II-containing protein